jgi:hypothetical protein
VSPPVTVWSGSWWWDQPGPDGEVIEAESEVAAWHWDDRLWHPASPAGRSWPGAWRLPQRGQTRAGPRAK